MNPELNRLLQLAGTALRQQASARDLLRLAWLLIALGILGLWLVVDLGWSSGWVLAGWLLAAAVGGGWVRWRERHFRASLFDVAREIEAREPDLQSGLLAALQQQPEGESGKLNFLQERLLAEMLDRAQVKEWNRLVREEQLDRLWMSAVSFGAVALLLGLTIAGSGLWQWWQTEEEAVVQRQGAIPDGADRLVVVEPGDVDLEKGTPLTVTARVEGTLPAGLWIEREGEEREPMRRALADPVFGWTLESVEEGFRYRVGDDEGWASHFFTVEVFEFPRIERIDVVLRRPDWMERAEERLEETRAVTVQEGTELELQVTMNQPMEALEGRFGKRKEAMAWEPVWSQEQRVATVRWQPEESGELRFTLRDGKGRQNREAEIFRVQVVKNDRPKFQIATPRGDRRVTPIEELDFVAKIQDDTELLAYGLHLALPDDQERRIALEGEGGKSGEVRHREAFEQLALEPNAMFTWYFWAEDRGPDGEVRRTTSDLRFGRVRAFEEVYREQPGGGGGAAMPEGMEILQTQQEIIIATFNSVQEPKRNEDRRRADMEVIRDSQAGLVQVVEEALPRITNPRVSLVVQSALEEMKLALVPLEQAAETAETESLQAALPHERKAYETLLELMGSEFMVSQGQEGSGTSSESMSLDKLDLKQEEDRYEEARRAELEQTEEELELRQILNRLKELAKRQKDLNDKLNELQVALQQAESEEERERIERELKRLEDEQREMLAEMDDLQNRMNTAESLADNQAQERQAQLEEAREAAREAKQNLEERDLSQALAEGRRAEEQFEALEEEVRGMASNALAQELAGIQEKAREMVEEQKALNEELGKGEPAEGRPTLDGADEESTQGRLAAQEQRLEALMSDTRELAEAAADEEPLVAEDLAEAYRVAEANQLGERLEAIERMNRFGSPEASRQLGEAVQRGLEEMEAAIGEAAERVMGNEMEVMRFAQAEVRELAEEVRQPARSDQSDQSDQQDQGQQGQGQGSEGPQLQAAQPGQPNAQGQTWGGGPLGPNAEGFEQWSDRVRNLEELVLDPAIQSSLYEARDAARRIRAEARRRAEPPNQQLVLDQILKPLDQAAEALADRLAELDPTDDLRPVERDPVPDRFADSVDAYYEELAR